MPVYDGRARWLVVADRVSGRSLREFFYELRDQYPIDARGSWTERFPERSLDRQMFEATFNRGMISSLRQSLTARTSRDIVFLSHRQADHTEAVKLASEIEARTHFKVWLDVWDPNLPMIQGNPLLQAEQKAILIAMIIEMGLLNSKGVIALMTPASRGSDWIPYEYGRVKTGGPLATEACAAITGGLQNIPEYMLLGPQCYFKTGSSDIGGFDGLKGWIDGL